MIVSQEGTRLSTGLARLEARDPPEYDTPSFFEEDLWRRLPRSLRTCFV